MNTKSARVLLVLVLGLLSSGFGCRKSNTAQAPPQAPKATAKTEYPVTDLPIYTGPITHTPTKQPSFVTRAVGYVGQARTEEQLNAQFAPGQAPGSITPEDMLDLIKSITAGTIGGGGSGGGGGTGVTGFVWQSGVGVRLTPSLGYLPVRLGVPQNCPAPINVTGVNVDFADKGTGSAVLTIDKCVNGTDESSCTTMFSGPEYITYSETGAHYQTFTPSLANTSLNATDRFRIYFVAINGQDSGSIVINGTCGTTTFYPIHLGSAIQSEPSTGIYPVRFSPPSNCRTPINMTNVSVDFGTKGTGDLTFNVQRCPNSTDETGCANMLSTNGVYISTSNHLQTFTLNQNNSSLSSSDRFRIQILSANGQAAGRIQLQGTCGL